MYAGCEESDHARQLRTNTCSCHRMWRFLEAVDSPCRRWYPLIGNEHRMSQQSLLFALEVVMRVTRKRLRDSCGVMLCDRHAESCSVSVIAGRPESTLHSHLVGINRRAPQRRVLGATHLWSSVRLISWTADPLGRCVRKHALAKIEVVPLTLGT